MNPIYVKKTNTCINREESLGDLFKLPNEMIKEIFSHLSLKELGRCWSTSRAFKVLAKDPRLWIPQIAFGKKQWETYFGEVGVEPPLPENIIEILSTRCPFFANQRISDTHMLVLIPATVGGEALNLNRLGELIQHPNNNGHATNYKYYSDSVREAHGNTESGRSYWVLMTKDVILGSRHQTYTAQQELVTQQGEGNYTLPRALEAAVCILMEHVVSGNQLFGRNPLTYTRCSETVEQRYLVVVGGFGSDGLYVSFSLSYFFDFDNYGVGALRKFF